MRAPECPDVLESAAVSARMLPVAALPRQDERPYFTRLQVEGVVRCILNGLESSANGTTVT
jgi:hypothetical protein